MKAPPVPPAPYFPFYLNNGSDSVLLDYSGSMNCDSGHLHLEQHGGAICSWQKYAHRKYKRNLIPLAQCTYRVMADDGELFEIGSFEQEFKPGEGTLVTTVETTVVKLRVTARLLRDQPLYIEEFRVLWVRPKTKVVLAFLARPAHLTLPGLSVSLPAGTKWSWASGEEAGADSLPMVCGTYAFDEVEGSIAMAVRGGMVTRHSIQELRASRLRVGSTVRRIISLTDTAPTADATPARERVLYALPSTAAIVRQDVKRCAENEAPTRVELPDNELQRQYRLSLWLIRASQNQDNGFITTGPYGAFKGGGHACFWDWAFPIRALLSSNQIHAASRLLDYYSSTIDGARAYAAQIGKPGAYYPWFSNCRGESLDFQSAAERPGIQKWNNCCVAQQLLWLWRYTGDTADLRKRLPIAREVLTFLLATIVHKTASGYEVTPIEGADENIDRRNDTAHLITLMDALRLFAQGSEQLGEAVPKEWTDTLAGLERAFQGNYRDGVLMPYAGAREFSSESFSFESLYQPNSVSLRTLDESLKRSRGAWGLTNGTTYRNLIWPWTEGRAALAFSFYRPQLAFERVKHVLQFASSLGVFPEKIRPDGHWILFGYLSAHASVVGATNAVLATDNGSHIKVAVGVPKEWRELSFSDVLTPSGFRVALKLSRGRVKELSVTNNHAGTRKVTVELLSRSHRDHRVWRAVPLSGRARLI